MAKLLLAGLVMAVFMAAILSVGGEEYSREKRDFSIQTISYNDFLHLICDGNPFASQIYLCNDYKPSTTPTTTTSTTTKYNQASTTQSTTASPTTTAATATTTPSASALERAHWCRFSNGTYIPLGHTFMNTECTLCQCSQSHAIKCTTLQCMNSYCIDASAPNRRQGQCCPQCRYENTSTTCVVNGITFPHGTVLKKTSDGVYCWCQLGTVECRKFSASIFSSLDYWGEGTAVYVIVIIICIMLIIGTLLCCVGALFFYYYYKRNQQATQQAYEHYYNTAGWQPMGDDGQIIDQTAEEKKAEAEQTQYEYEYPTGYSEEYVAPPYALYSGFYVEEQVEQEQKQT